MLVPDVFANAIDREYHLRADRFRRSTSNLLRKDPTNLFESKDDHFILMRVNIGRAGRSSMAGRKVLTVLALMVAADAVDPTPSLDTCPISDE